MPTFLLTVAYDGTAYAGWQRQTGQPTVQAEVERVLLQVTGQAVTAVASGRTDAGVHAFGQAVSVEVETYLSPRDLLRALNAELADDVAVLDVRHVRAGTHATREAISKRYRYVLNDSPVRDVFARAYCWKVHKPLDDEVMHRAGQALVGRHDFRAFETQHGRRLSSVRTVMELSVFRVAVDEPNAMRRRHRPTVHLPPGKGGRRPDEGGSLPGFLHPGPLPEGEGEMRVTSNQDPTTSNLSNGRIHIEVSADGFLYNMVRAIVGTLVEVGRGARPERWPAHVLASGQRGQAGITAPPRGLFLVSVEYPPTVYLDASALT